MYYVNCYSTFPFTQQQEQHFHILIVNICARTFIHIYTQYTHVMYMCMCGGLRSASANAACSHFSTIGAILIYKTILLFCCRATFCYHFTCVSANLKCLLIVQNTNANLSHDTPHVFSFRRIGLPDDF